MVFSNRWASDHISNRQTGVGLIEVLVSLLVIAIGLLGLAALQGRALKAEAESISRSEALTALQSMAAQLRANRADSDPNDGKGGSNAYVTSQATCGDTSSIVGQDLCRWSQALESIGGYGCIKKEWPEYLVIVEWPALMVDKKDGKWVGLNQGGKPECKLIPSDIPKLNMSVPVRFFDPGQ